MKRTSLLLFACTVLWPSFAWGAAESPYNPDFLISDEEIQNWQSMNLEDVHVFLDQNGSSLTQLTTPDVDGTPRRASEIIIRAAQTHRINPKYILVKLQKEQSLITDPNPTQKQLDWATGYGVCDGCYLADPNVQKHKGFGTQVDASAGIIRWYYDNASISPIVKQPHTLYLIDNTPIHPANFATAFLYTYTPHLHGNKNFWLLWQKWFEQTYPDGTLAKSKTEPTVYLIQGGQKRAFATMTALVSRFDPSRIITMAKTELDAYETGPELRIPNYSILKQNDAYYLLDYDILRPFASPDVVAKLGFHPDEVINVTPTDIEGMTIGTPITADTEDPIGQVVLVEENRNLYFVKDKTYAFITHPAIAKNRFPLLTPVTMPASAFANYTQAPPILFGDGVLFGVAGDNKIYVTEHGRKRHIPTEAVFLALGYSWDDVVWVDPFTGLNHPTGAPMSAPRSTAIASTHSETTPAPSPKANDVMVRVPDAETKYAGLIFDTSVNTYLVADAAGVILAGKNIDTVRPMASFAKVMTAYRLLKEGVSLSRASTYDPAKHKTPYANFRIAAGEQVLNDHLMLAFLPSSLNTPANMMLTAVEKDTAKFIARMNEQVKSWGLAKTVFRDINGEDERTVATAKEYLTLYRNATDNIDLRRILGTASYRYDELKDLDGKPGHYDTNSNELLARADLPFRIVASKTGYLDEAGAGLTMTVERLTDKKQFIIITMGNPDNSARKFNEPERLARWAMMTF